MLFFLSFYQQVVSPYMPGQCRYVPTCSEYARDAIEHLGAWRGGRRAFVRLMRCNPFIRVNYDAISVRPITGGEKVRKIRDKDESTWTKESR